MSTDILQLSQTGNVQGVIQCLQQNKETISTRDSWGGTALHWACDKGHLDIVHLLLQSGADKDAKTHQNMTPLHCACSAGHFDVIRALLQYGADKDAKNRDGWAPIHYAADEGHLNIVQLLVDNGADKNAKDKNNNNALLYAQRLGFSDIASYLNADAKVEVPVYRVCGKYPLWSFVWSVLGVLFIYAGSMSMIAIGVTWLYSATTVCGFTLATAQFSVSTDSTFRHFSGNSCPGYNWFAISDPYKAGLHPFSFALPAMPQLSTIPLNVGVKSTSGNPVLGAIGIALNGVAIYGNGDGYGEDAVMSRATDYYDICGGTVIPGIFLDTGIYNYQTVPGDTDPLSHTDINTADLNYCAAVQKWYTDQPYAHSPLMGFMADGIPIYGPRGGSGDVPTDLDSCGGHAGDGVSFYHYHFQTSYPYSVECLSGCVPSSWMKMNPSIQINPCDAGGVTQYDYSSLIGFATSYGGSGVNKKAPVGGPIELIIFGVVYLLFALILTYLFYDEAKYVPRALPPSAMRASVRITGKAVSESGRKRRIVAKRGYFHSLPVYCENDMVHGSWWMVWGSFLGTLIPVIPLADIWLPIFPVDNNNEVHQFDDSATWVFCIVSGIFSIVGSYMFVRTFKDPAPPPLLPHFKHASTDELIAAWLFLLATLPLVPYTLIFLLLEPHVITYWMNFTASVISVIGSLFFVYTCYPAQNHSIHGEAVTYSHFLLPHFRRIFGEGHWILYHVQTDWLASTWIAFWSIVLFALGSYFLMIASTNLRQFYLWFTTFIDMMLFVVGSAYYCAASYPADVRFDHIDHDDVVQSRRMSDAPRMIAIPEVSSKAGQNNYQHVVWNAIHTDQQDTIDDNGLFITMEKNSML